MHYHNQLSQEKSRVDAHCMFLDSFGPGSPGCAL